MGEKAATEDLLIEAKQFLEQKKEIIGRAVKSGLKQATFDMQEIAEFNPAFAEQIIQQPEDMLRILGLALNETGLIKDARFRLSSLPESQRVKIRDIRSKHLNTLIVMDGIVRQASDVRPQVITARFECPACGATLSVLQIEKKFREPTRCSCGRKGRFKLVAKDLVDAQRLVIEESPEMLEGGEQPRRINVFLKEKNHKMLKLLAASRRISMNKVLVRALEKEVSSGKKGLLELFQ